MPSFPQTTNGHELTQNQLLIKDACVCVSGCRDNVSPDEWKENVGGFSLCGIQHSNHTVGFNFDEDW